MTFQTVLQFPTKWLSGQVPVKNSYTYKLHRLFTPSTSLHWHHKIAPLKGSRESVSNDSYSPELYVPDTDAIGVHIVDTEVQASHKEPLREQMLWHVSAL
jgi:hypothetical protein